jgi:hypothetical protein
MKRGLRKFFGFGGLLMGVAGVIVRGAASEILFVPGPGSPPEDPPPKP